MPAPTTAMRFMRRPARRRCARRGRGTAVRTRCRRAPPGERGRREGGGEPPGDFSRQGRPAPRRKPVRRVAPARPLCRHARRSARRAASSPARRRLRRIEFRPVPATDSARPARHRPALRRLGAADSAADRVGLPRPRGSRRATTLPPLQGRRCSIPNSSSSSKPSAGTWTRTSPGTRFDAVAADRRAGADDQDERHHRVGGAAGHRDVPARQPRRQRLLARS